jgi:eukaryotic-like serine/threonine-protein kinase
MEAASAALSSSELILGHYRPLRPLGSGSSGSVWLARDERNGLDVALKVVPREGRLADRAEREAGVAARLRHPRCQRIYEHASDDGHIYIAYEYVPGCTLREAIRGNRLTDRDAIEATAQILEGLAHAHAKGIVHRDVKPANVILADQQEISVRLLDFGLAQFESAATLTAVGDVPGTLAYISPERLAGEHATPASDVWAVGVLLWEALAGRHPFWAPSLPATGKKIKEGAPPLESVRPDLPPTLHAVVARALELDPRLRPSAAELAKQLRGALKTKVAAPLRRGRKPPTIRTPARPGVLAARILPPLLAALFTGWVSASIPFFPTAWPAGLALLAGALTLLRPRIGLAFALAVPILPLGNASFGLAILYVALAATWFAAHVRAPQAAFAFVAGPLLAPIAMIGLLPLVLQKVPGAPRRAAHAFVGVLMAAVVAGVRAGTLPFTDSLAPTLALHATQSPFTAASALVDALFARPEVLIVAILLGAVAAAIPFALRRGLPWIAGLSAALLAGLILGAPHAPVIPLVAAGWLTAVALALQDRGWKPLVGAVGAVRLRFE